MSERSKFAFMPYGRLGAALPELEWPARGASGAGNGKLKTKTGRAARQPSGLHLREKVDDGKNNIRARHRRRAWKIINAARGFGPALDPAPIHLRPHSLALGGFTCSSRANNEPRDSMSTARAQQERAANDRFPTPAEFSAK